MVARAESLLGSGSSARCSDMPSRAPAATLEPLTSWARKSAALSEESCTMPSPGQG